MVHTKGCDDGHVGGESEGKQAWRVHRQTVYSFERAGGTCRAAEQADRTTDQSQRQE